MPLDLGLEDFPERIVEIFGDVPAGIVRLHFGEVADVADVIAGPVLFRYLQLPTKIIHDLGTDQSG